MSEPAKVLCCIGIVIGVIGALLIVILVPMSLKKVEFDEVAIKYDKVSRKLNDEVLTEGLHSVGPSGTLLKFKTTQQQSSFSIATLTSDALEVELEVNVLWSIVPTDVRKILDKFGDQNGHHQFVTSFSENVVRDVASTFDATSFYLARQRFQTAVQTALSDRFKNGEVHADVDSAQVSNIELSVTVQNALEASTVAQQDIQNALSERSTDVQKALIALDLARSEAALTLIEADRDVAVIAEEAKQQVLAEAAKMQQRASAFSNISAGLGRGGDFFVRAYLKYLVMKNNAGTTVVGL